MAIRNYTTHNQKSAKRAFLTLIAMIATTLTALGQATQPCIVKQYNQKQTKTPLPGVQVEVRDAGSAASGTDGTLTLRFATLKPGDKVTLRRVTKAGYEIFNKTAIDQWNVSRSQQRLEIVLVKSDYFAQLKNNLTSSSTDNYKKKYEQAKAELARQQKAGKLKEEEYRKRINDLEDQYDNALKNLDSYIDQFARIDLSVVSAEEQRILEMVEQGKIDEAVKAYEELDITGKLRQARKNKKALSEAKARIEEEEAQQDQTIKELKEKQKREIATLKLAGGKENYDKVAQMLKENALADTTDINAVWEYAKYALVQGNNKDALHYYNLCQNICSPAQLSYFQHAVGSIYYLRGQYDEARIYYLRALETARHNKDSEMEAMVNQSLGTLYYDYFVKTYEYYNKYNIVEDYWQESYVIRNKLYEKESNLDNLNKLANIEIVMGMLYATKEEHAKAEDFYLLAQEHYGLLAHQKPEEYSVDLAKFYVKLGDYYAYCVDYPPSKSKEEEGEFLDEGQYLSLTEKQYLSALNIYSQLFDKNPDIYRNPMASIQHKLGKFYVHKIQNDDKARDYLSKCVHNLAILYNNNPDKYSENYGIALSDLGEYYEHKEDWSKAEELLLAALDIYNTKYYQDTGSVTEYGGLMKHLTKLVSLYSRSPEGYEKCEKFLKEKIRIEKERYDADNSNESLEKRLKEAITELGGFYLQNEKIEEGENTYEQIHQIDSKESVNWNFGVYYYNVASELVKKKDSISAEKNYLAALVYFNRFLNEDKSETLNIRIISNALYNLGAIYYNRKDYTKAEEFFLQTLEQNIQLFTRKPVAYRDNLALMQMRLADMYDETKDYIQAEQYYLQALENYKVLFSDKPDNYRVNLAWIQYSLMFIYAGNNAKLEQYDNMLDTALANYEALYQNNKDYQSTIVNLRNRKGWRLLQKGDTDEAMSLFESTYQLDPEKSVTYLASSCNAKAYEYTKTGNFPKALETIDRAIALMPDNANYYDSKGEILLMKGNEKEAVKMWQKVLELDPDFLSKHNGETELHQQLKAKKLIK